MDVMREKQHNCWIPNNNFFFFFFYLQAILVIINATVRVNVVSSADWDPYIVNRMYSIALFANDGELGRSVRKINGELIRAPRRVQLLL